MVSFGKLEPTLDNTVSIKTGDSHLWEPTQAAVEIVYHVMTHGKAIVNLMNEAPDLSCTELIHIFDYLLTKGIKFDQVEIHTGNIVECYDGFKVIKHPEWMYELDFFQHEYQGIDESKHLTKHFGCFIGRSNAERLIIASHLYDQHKDKTSLSFHFEPGSDFHRVHLGLEDIIYYFGTQSLEYRQALSLIANAPIKITNETIYPIANKKAINNLTQSYANIFVDVVAETFYTGNVFFLTEKFWRPVANKTPFILQAGQYSLRRLRQLGFRTFSQWWDEGYDEDPGFQRINEIRKVIDRLSLYSLDQLRAMLIDMQPVLDHNYEIMMQLKYRDFDIVK